MTNSHIHPTAVLGPHVTAEPGATIGPDCILDGRIRIGARTSLAAGVKLVGDIEIGPDCRLEAKVATASSSAAAGPCIGPIVIGAGAVIAAGLRMGSGAWIDAGSRIVRDVAADAIVRGDPGVVVGLRGRSARAADLVEQIADPKATAVADSAVAGVKIYRFPRITDPRGSLTFGEFGRNIPFLPQRFFLVFDVPDGRSRGGHAHATCEELVLCVGGSVTVLVDDGRTREEFVLDSPDVGLLIPSRVWGVEYKYSPGATLVVFASKHFDRKDYILDYNEFVAEIEGRG